MRSSYREIAKEIVRRIEELSKGIEKVRIMTFCGTHEWTVARYGIRSVLPPNIEVVAGPGCPVCVTPGRLVEVLAKLSLEGYTVLTYGDAYRLPSTPGSSIRSLEHAKSMGGDVRVVYSFLDAVKIARESRSTCIFFAIGFETTMPSTGEALLKGYVPRNLLILSAYKFTPPIMRYLLEVKKARIDGIIAPGHVSTVIGVEPWRFVVDEFGIPLVVAGFSPLDVLLAILEIVRQIREGRPRLVNEYRRSVKWEGNTYARRIIDSVYEVDDSFWRGIGVVPKSGAYLSERYRVFDAYTELGISRRIDFEPMPPGCRCSDVVIGMARPIDCPHFMKSCRPESPYGPCMVSYEGTCRIWAELGYQPPP